MQAVRVTLRRRRNRKAFFLRSKSEFSAPRASLADPAECAKELLKMHQTTFSLQEIYSYVPLFLWYRVAHHHPVMFSNNDEVLGHRFKAA